MSQKNNDAFINKHYHIIVVLIIFIQFLLVVFLGYHKNGYECDDLLTLNDASSLYTGGRRFYQQAELFNTWHTKQEWRDCLTVNSEETLFSQSVETIWKTMMGQGKMLNCNFYMFLLNFVASFFPNHFSIWISILFNFGIFQISQFVMVQISKKLITDKLYRICLMLFYSFSTGVLACITYIRFYMLVTLMVLLLLWLLFMIAEASMIIRCVQHSFLLLIVCYFGYRTHQYFAIYGILAIMGVLLYMLLTKQFKKVLVLIAFWGSSFAIMMLSVNIRGWLIYMLTKGEGANQISRLLEWNDCFWENLCEYGIIFYRHLICNSFNLIVCIIGVFFSLYIQIANKSVWKSKKKILLMVIAMSIVLYIFFLNQVSSSPEWRYLSVIYAPTILCLVTLIYTTLIHFKSNEVKKICVLLGFLFLLNLVKNDLRENGVDYIYYDDTQKREILENDYAELDNIYVCQKSLWNLALDYNVMTENSRTMYVTQNSVYGSDVFSDTYEKGACLLWISFTQEKGNDIIQDISVKTEYKTIEYIFSTKYSNVYIMRKE